MAGERGGGHLIADGEWEPVGNGQAGVEQLRDVPGVGVRGLREAEVDVDGPAVLRVDAAQRAADGRSPVSACSGPSPGQRREEATHGVEGALRAAGMDVDGPVLQFKASPACCCQMRPSLSCEARCQADACRLLLS